MSKLKSKETVKIVQIACADQSEACPKDDVPSVVVIAEIRLHLSAGYEEGEEDGAVGGNDSSTPPPPPKK